MMSGQVNSEREAIIVLTIYGAYGETLEIEALIDTGYTSYLTLPSAVIATLGLNAIGTEQLTLADGSEVTSDLYLAPIVWDGRDRLIEVDSLESEPLIGMALMDGCNLNIQVAIGGNVTLTSSSVQP